MNLSRFGHGRVSVILFVLAASGCSMVDGRESGKYDDGARFHMKLTKALVAPTWYEEGVYDEHQRGFINLVQQMRMRGYPVSAAELMTETQVLSYSEGKVSQRPRDFRLGDATLRISKAVHQPGSKNVVLWYVASVETKDDQETQSLLRRLEDSGVPVHVESAAGPSANPSAAGK